MYKLKPISELNLGFVDAENYKERENREMLNQIFVRTPMLDKLCNSSTYFLVGDKGTGKTAYAIFLSNNNYKENRASLHHIRETDYQKFVTLKKQKQLDLSDYTNIWKVIIFLLLAKQIKDNTKNILDLKVFRKFDDLYKAIDEYYAKAFSPEIMHALEFANNSKLAAEIIAKHAGLAGKIGAEKNSQIVFSENRFQTNLLYIQNAFENAFSSLRLSQNQLLFIDGIDIRPSSIDYNDYLECVKGLANAVWSINSDFFANIKDSDGRIRVILLIRPDIFNSLGLQNLNSKIRDNSVILSWLTSYTEYRNSDIFQMADRLLSYQQDTVLPLGVAWDYYFPYYTSYVTSEQIIKSAFISFLRFSLYRPRDILTMLSIQKENFVIEGNNNRSTFIEKDFFSPIFTRKYSDYVLGEVRDHISFYYSSQEYEYFLKFFEYLKGKPKFSYDEFLVAFSNYENFISRNLQKIPGFMISPEVFLQFLYDTNIICSKTSTYENEQFYGWCYRERSPSNIAPKVRTESNYEVHHGLRKALDLGKHFDY